MIQKENNQGLRRSMHILQALGCAKRDGMSFGTLREALGGISSTSLNRSLIVLREEGWITRGDDGYYYPGEIYLQSAAQIFSSISSEINLEDIVYDLAHETKQSAAYAEYNGRGFVFRAKCEMPDSYHHIPVGSTNSDLFKNGYGVVCLACQPSSAKQRILASVPADISKVAQNMHECIGRENFYLSHDNGTRFISPIFLEPEHVFLGALGISTISSELSEDDVARYSQAVHASAQKVFSRLKHHSVSL